MRVLAILGVLAAAAAANIGRFVDRTPIPAHLMNHTLVDKENFLSPEIVEELLENTRKASPIFSSTKEPAVFATVEDNIGEAVPATIDPETGAKTCPHGLLALDNSGTRCVLPGRVDVGRHYLVTGGPEAKKEEKDVLVSRVQPFLHYILDYKNVDVTKRLLEAPEMVKFAENICPPGKPYLDPFQFNYVVQVPGQTVATHVDAVYFRKASRFHMPQWLLAVMHFSGLFKEDFVDQVQIVAYYHKWTDERAGKFLFWNDPVSRKPQISLPISRSANSVDGSKVIHAAAVYMPWRLPPVLPRVARNTLEYRNEGGEHFWDVKSDGKVMATYPEDELRFSAVYRCRCFKSREDFEQFERDQMPANAWNVSHVLGILRADMDARGILPKAKQVPALELAELLLKTYVKYPLSPDAAIPYNLCAITEIDYLAFLKPIVDIFCK
ncbi:hypothetical protein DFJ74DRAFT_696622 [Hyaloraphidium curvatum]|nr:hypothetical protein DFJ74DRAFT_696622 [Hyaloraphidium curvatum]